MTYEERFKGKLGSDASKDFPWKEVGVRVPGGCYTAQTHSIPIDCGYEPLFFILRDALNQSMVGKGRARHANGKPWTEQPICEITRSVGSGFPLGQAMKKINESQRLDADAAERELLGAIVYLCAAIQVNREERDGLGRDKA